MRLLAKANFKGRQIAKSYSSSARVGKFSAIGHSNPMTKMSYKQNSSVPSMQRQAVGEQYNK